MYLFIYKFNMDILFCDEVKIERSNYIVMTTITKIRKIIKSKYIE